jgi:hypothetical protein
MTTIVQNDRVAYAPAAAILQSVGHDVVYADSCTIAFGIAVMGENEEGDYAAYLANGFDSDPNGLGLGWSVQVTDHTGDRTFLTTNLTMVQAIAVAMTFLHHADEGVDQAVINAQATLRDVREG